MPTDDDVRDALAPPSPLPPHLYPQPGALGPDDLRVVISTDELRTVVRLLDVEGIAGFAMLTQRDGSPWVELDIAVPHEPEIRASLAREVAELGAPGTHRFAIWRYNSGAYRLDLDGAVADEPIDLGR